MYAVSPIPVNSSSVAADRTFIGSAPHHASTAATARARLRHDAERGDRVYASHGQAQTPRIPAASTHRLARVSWTMAGSTLAKGGGHRAAPRIPPPSVAADRLAVRTFSHCGRVLDPGLVEAAGGTTRRGGTDRGTTQRSEPRPQSVSGQLQTPPTQVCGDVHAPHSIGTPQLSVPAQSNPSCEHVSDVHASSPCPTAHV